MVFDLIDYMKWAPMPKPEKEEEKTDTAVSTSSCNVAKSQKHPTANNSSAFSREYRVKRITPINLNATCYLNPKRSVKSSPSDAISSNSSFGDITISPANAGSVSSGISNLQNAPTPVSPRQLRLQNFLTADSISIASSRDIHDKPNTILRKRISATVHPTKGIVSEAFMEERNNQSQERIRRSFTRMRSVDRHFDSIEDHNLSSNDSSLNSSLPPSPGILKNSKHNHISDLDIHIANSQNFSFDSKQNEDEPNERFNHYARRRGRKDLISNTVDMWAKQSSLDENGSQSDKKPKSDVASYKPLVFGGTFPIDTPASPPQGYNESFCVKEETVSADDESVCSSVDNGQRKLLQKTIEQSLDNFERALAKRQRDLEVHKKTKKIVKTFDIDEPMTLDDICRESLKSVIDGTLVNKPPRTYDIDEPI